MKENRPLHHIKQALYVAITLCLHLVGTAGHAHAAAGLPEELHGEWYLASCERPQMMVVNTRYFSLQVERSGRTIFMLVNDVAKYEDYYKIMINWSASIYHINQRGELLHNIAPDRGTSTASLPQSWAEIENNGFNISYVRCENNDLLQSVSPGLAALMAVFKKLDSLHENCPYIGREANLACHKMAFDIADSNQNGTLEYDEITKIHKAINYFHSNMASEEIGSQAEQNEKANGFVRDIAGLTGQENPEDLAITYETTKEKWPELWTIQSGQDFMIMVETLHQRIAGDMIKVSDCSTESSLVGSAIPQSTVNAENQSCFTEGESYILEPEESTGQNETPAD